VLDPVGQGTAQQVQDGVRMAASALADAGYAVDEREPPGIDAAANALLVMDSAPGVRAVWEQVLSASAPADLRRFVPAFFAAAGEPDAVAAEQSFITRHVLLQAWGAFQETHPLIVAPVATDVPFVAGTDLDEGRVAETIRTMRMVMAVNALGLPAVAVPVGVADELPQVVQIIGPRYREDLCLDAAEALEQAMGVITPIDPRWMP
jgi:amidase